MLTAFPACQELYNLSTPPAQDFRFSGVILFFLGPSVASIADKERHLYLNEKMNERPCMQVATDAAISA